MVHIYYHIYGVENVQPIIDEQLSLIQTHFNFPHILNVGISIGNNNIPNTWLWDSFYNNNKPNYRIRDVRANGSEFVTLDLIEKDRETFGNSDYILYLHTKGASKIDRPNYNILEGWRRYMNYFNIEKVSNVFKIFEQTDYNTYGCNFVSDAHRPHYSGNFWWAKSDYIKSIDVTDVNKNIRFDAEVNYLKNGINWKPYSSHNSNVNNYSVELKRKDYAK